MRDDLPKPSIILAALEEQDMVSNCANSPEKEDLGASMEYLEQVLEETFNWLVWMDDLKIGCRATNLKDTHVTYSKEGKTLKVMLGKNWEETILDLKLPLAEYRWEGLTVLVSARKPRTKIVDDVFEVYAVEVVRIAKKESLFGINVGKVQTRYLATTTLPSGKVVAKLDYTIQKAIDAATEEMTKILIDKMGI